MVWTQHHHYCLCGHLYFAPLALSKNYGALNPGPMAQAITFRAVGAAGLASKSLSHSDLKTEIIISRAEISGRTLFVLGHK
jgi:hypothetical protein